MKTPKSARPIQSAVLVILIAILAIPDETSQAGKGRTTTPTIRLGPENLANPDQGYIPGELLIKFVTGAPDRAIQNAANGIGGQSIKTFAQIGVRHWKLGPGMSVERALEILGRPGLQKHVEFAEPNFILQLDDVYPDDPLRVHMWGLHNVGQTGGVQDADIDAPGAWEIQRDSPNIVVGVIDSGIEYMHDDLRENILVNPGEDANGNGVLDDTDFNGIDDDGNGIVDDVVRGWDFVNDDHDPDDDRFHGTHVAGTIGAVGNNALGVTGVSWNVKLMPVKAFNNQGSGTTADVIDAIFYAASFGAHVTNNSWGGGRRSKALERAIENAGTLFVAAAGNSGSNKAAYPASFSLDNIISVAATDDQDGLASFSNYNEVAVDLGAPGVNVLSTMIGNQYAWDSGTSMATPHVTGVAALVMARFPGSSNADVKSRILNNVDSVPSLAGKTVTGGRLNALRALGGVEPPVADDTFAPDAVGDLVADSLATTDSTVMFAWSAPEDQKGDGSIGPAYAYDIRYLANDPISEANWDSAVPVQGGPWPEAPGTAQLHELTGLSPGTIYYLALKSMDEAGNRSNLSNVASERTTKSAAGWSVETVESAGNVGEHNALALDAADNPAIAYSYTNGASEVRFAHWNGSAWDKEVIGDSSINSQLFYDVIDLVYDSTGTPCMSVVDTGGLRYACRNGSSWNFEVIQKSKGSGTPLAEASLAYDPGGSPSLSYWVSGRNGGLKFARFDNGSWTTDFVESKAAGVYNSLAYDNDGNPAIAYSDDVDGNGYIESLKFARWNGSSWNIEIVESSQSFGIYVSLAFDPTTGFPSIVHRSTGNVRFASWNGVSWDIELVDTALVMGLSLAYDSTGSAHISYQAGLSSPNSCCEVVKLAKQNGAGWDIQIIDMTTRTVGQTSLKLDSAGNPSISYFFDSDERDLKFARE